MHPAALRLVANRVVEPAVEPVTLDEAKLHLREDGSAQDAYINSLITASREYVENDILVALNTQQWQRKLDWFPRDFWEPILLPRPPLQSVESVTFIDDAGNEQTLDTGAYIVDTDSTAGRVWRHPDVQWPETDLGRPNAVTVSYTAGYGSAASDVPEPLRHAIKLLVAQLFENRQPEVTGTTVAALGKSYDWLVAPYKTWWF